MRGRGLGERRERKPTRVLGGGIHACLIRILEAVFGHGTGMSKGQIIIYASKASDFTFSILFVFSTLFRSMLAAMTLVRSTNA